MKGGSEGAKTIIGQAIVLGDNIDTDQIYPGRYLELVDPKEIGRHCLAGVDPEIAPNFKPGDIVVAGKNFGCGSSREHAAIALINMGASLVLAESFARIFFRNAINLGLPLVICPGISQKVKAGQTLKWIWNRGPSRSRRRARFGRRKAWEQAAKILAAGGIKPLFGQKWG